MTDNRHDIACKMPRHLFNGPTTESSRRARKEKHTRLKRNLTQRTNAPSSERANPCLQASGLDAPGDLHTTVRLTREEKRYVTNHGVDLGQRLSEPGSISSPFRRSRSSPSSPYCHQLTQGSAERLQGTRPNAAPKRKKAWQPRTKLLKQHARRTRAQEAAEGELGGLERSLRYNLEVREERSRVKRTELLVERSRQRQGERAEMPGESFDFNALGPLPTAVASSNDERERKDEVPMGSFGGNGFGLRGGNFDMVEDNEYEDEMDE